MTLSSIGFWYLWLNFKYSWQLKNISILSKSLLFILSYTFEKGFFASISLLYSRDATSKTTWQFPQCLFWLPLTLLWNQYIMSFVFSTKSVVVRSRLLESFENCSVHGLSSYYILIAKNFLNAMYRRNELG